MRNIFLFVIGVLVSCSGSNNDNTKSFDYFGFSMVEKLKSSTLSSSAYINNSFDLKIFSDHLFVYDPESGFQYKIINISNNSYVGQFGKTGDGPCELFFPSTLSFSGNDLTSLGINNRTTAKFQEYDLSKVDEFPSSICFGQTKTLDINFQQLVKISEDEYLGVGLFDKRYVVFNVSADSIVHKLGEYPFQDQFLDVPYNVMAMAFQGHLLKHPTKNKIVMNTTGSFNIDILDYSSNKGIIYVAKIQHWPPDFTWTNGNQIGAIMTAENKFGGISTAVSKSYIYILFSGKKNSTEKSRSSDKIFVYSWEGNPVKILELDQLVDQIAVDTDDNIIIAYHDDGTPNLYRFDLK